MDGLTRMLAGLLRCLAGLLGEHRRDWVHALLAETGDQPAPSARLAWLGGGLWLVAREVLLNRIIQALAFVAGAAGLVWIAWPGAAANSATPVNRMFVAGTLVLLAGLPSLVRRYAGPVRPGWAPRAVRAGGYAVVLALIAATAVQQRIGSQLGGYFPVILPIWAMDVGFLLILGGYVAGLLILTSRRVQFTRRVLPLALGIGALTAGVLYPLAPFGINDTAETALHSLHGGPVVVADYLVIACFVLAALAVPAGRARRGHPPGRPRQSACHPQPGPAGPAGHCRRYGHRSHPGGAVHYRDDRTVAAPLTGPHQAVGNGICPTCEPSTIVIPASLRHEYYFEDSVNGAGDGTIALLVVPLIGAALGALRGHLRYPPAATRPEGLPEGA